MDWTSSITDQALDRDSPLEETMRKTKGARKVHQEQKMIGKSH